MRKDIDLLNHMMEDINDIMEFTDSVTYDDFIHSALLKKAISMSLINIGELSKMLSPSFKNDHKNVPWKNIAGLRDVTAHKYHTLNLDVVWAVAVQEIPKLKQTIESFLSKV